MRWLEIVDPTGEATVDLSAHVTEWVTTYGIPLILALFVLGVGLKLFLKFGRKSMVALDLTTEDRQYMRENPHLFD